MFDSRLADELMLRKWAAPFEKPARCPSKRERAGMGRRDVQDPRGVPWPRSGPRHEAGAGKGWKVTSSFYMLQVPIILLVRACEACRLSVETEELGARSCVQRDERRNPDAAGTFLERMAAVVAVHPVIIMIQDV